MRKWNARERVFFNLAAGVLTLFVIDCVIVTPLWNTWEGVNQAIEKEQAQIADDKRLILESEQIKKEYAVSFPSRQAKEQEHPSGEMTSLLREIETLASQSGIKIHDIKPQTSSGLSTKSQSVFISVESSWDALAPFIYAVQRSPQLLRIQKGDLHRNGDDESRISGQFIISEV